MLPTSLRSSAQRFVWLVHAAIAIAHPSLNRDDLVVQIEGGKAAADGTIAPPNLRFASRTNNETFLEELSLGPLQRAARFALSKLPDQGKLIGQTRDRSASDRDYSHLQSLCLLEQSGTSSIGLTAHEQIASFQALLTRAGLA